MAPAEKTVSLVASLVLFALSLLFVGGAAVAGFVPLLPCPQRTHESPEEMDPCNNCNGHGRATLFQRWNWEQFTRQENKNFQAWQY